MAENQNPVFTDDSLTGDGTVESPLAVAGGGGGGSVGAKGVVQLSDGSGGFEQPSDESSDNELQFNGAQIALVSASIFIQCPPGGTAAICSQFASGDLTLGNSANDILLKGSRLNISNVQTFANNAAALAGGLVSGDVYKNGADPDVRCIVD